MHQLSARFWFLIGFVLLVWLTACRDTEPALPQPTDTPVVQVIDTLAPTVTPEPQPTATPEPQPTATPTAVPTATPPSELNYTDGARNSADFQLYLPDAVDGPLPVLVIFHGAGVDKTDYRGMAAHFAEQGYAVVAPDYRGRNMAEDALCVLGWVQANAEAQPFDLSRVAVFGHSRGAIPTALAALVDDAGELMGACPHPAPNAIDVQAAATFGGVFGDLAVCGADTACLRPYSGLLGVSSAELIAILDQVDGVPPHAWRQVDTLTDADRAILAQLPLYWLDDADPPLLIIHRENDVTVDSSGAQAFAAAYTAAGAPSTLLILPGTSHNDPMNANTDGFLEMAGPLAEFLDEQMPDP